VEVRNSPLFRINLWGSEYELEEDVLNYLVSARGVLEQTHCMNVNLGPVTLIERAKVTNGPIGRR
jgi:hypothetical protein